MCRSSRIVARPKKPYLCELTKELGNPDLVIDFFTDCIFGEHNFEDVSCHRIKTKYQIIDTDNFQMVQSTYCKHSGCGSRQDKVWNL